MPTPVHPSTWTLQKTVRWPPEEDVLDEVDGEAATTLVDTGTVAVISTVVGFCTMDEPIVAPEVSTVAPTTVVVGGIETALLVVVAGGRGVVWAGVVVSGVGGIVEDDVTDVGVVEFPTVPPATALQLKPVTTEPTHS